MTIEEIIERTDHIPSSVYPSEQAMWLKYFHSLPEGTKIVDFGTGWGKSAASLSLACPHGFVITFDKGEVYVMHGNVPNLEAYAEAVGRYLDKADIINCIHLYGADSLDPQTMIEVMEEVDKDEIDILNFDSEHSYEMTLAELKIWLPKVKIGGFISVHDWEHPDCPGVTEAWNEYIKSGVVSVEFVDKSVGPKVTTALFRRTK